MRYAALDGWRGIAAIVVCLYHLGVFGTFYNLSFIRNGGYFVEFFFVLSGFVLAHAYGATLRDRVSLSAFVVRRIGRLWPLHLFTLAMLVCNEGLKWSVLRYGGFHAGTGAFANTASVEALILSIFMLNGLGFFTKPTWNVPSWSISAEFFTYLLFAWVCYRAQARRIPAILGVSALAGAGALLGLNLLGAPWLRVAFLVCICEFFLGVVAHAIYIRCRDRVRLPWGGLEIVAVALIVYLFQFGGLRQYVVILPLLFSLTIIVFAFEAGPISRILCSRPVQYLGLVSYSIYLVHFVVLTALNSGTRVAEQVLHRDLRLVAETQGGRLDVLMLHPPWMGDIVALAYLVVVVCVATWTFRFVELPGQRPFVALAKRIRQGQGLAAMERIALEGVGHPHAGRSGQEVPLRSERK